MENNNNKFNQTIVRAYKSKKGFTSVDIDSETFDNLQKIEVGGRLILKVMETKTNEKSPDAYFEYVTPTRVKEQKEFVKRYKEGKGKQSSEDVL